MNRINWRALMQLGLVDLRLSPHRFWALTPAELMLMTGVGGEVTSLSRAGFADLATSFPDEIKE
ncbi:hypothetical protein A9Q96_10240 [Rhodobacterales bacterium 52_120_T64]|nr:hypothetical protein A9Q96_10240 [Rhodobacterales bacterium 52_120_T64]